MRTVDRHDHVDVRLAERRREHGPRHGVVLDDEETDRLGHLADESSNRNGPLATNQASE